MLQMHPTLCDFGLQPARILYPWDSPDKNTGVLLPSPPPGDLHDPGIKSVSLFLYWQEASLPLVLPGKPPNSFNKAIFLTKQHPGKLIYVYYSLSLRNVNSVAAAAAAKSLQSCPTLCDPIDGSPSGFPVPGILQARTLEWVAISFSNA